MSHVLRLDGSQVSRGLRGILGAFDGLNKPTSVRLEWQEPFLWIAANQGRVWSWCRLLPRSYDAAEIPAIDVPIAALGSTGEGALTIEIGDSEIRSSVDDGPAKSYRFTQSKWPQFRIADRLAQVATAGPETHVSLGWIPVAHLRALLSLSVTGSDAALIKANPPIQLVLGAEASWAYSESPVGFSAAGVGAGIEQPIEISISFMMARAVAHGALGTQAEGWAAITMGMIPFGEWWASFVAGEGSMRFGVTAPSGYEDLLQLLALQLPQMVVDSVGVLAHPMGPGPDDPSSKKQVCVTLGDGSISISGQQLQADIHGAPGTRCVRQGDLSSIMHGVEPTAFGWFNVPDADQLWMSWQASGAAQLVGIRSTRAGALKPAGDASTADLIMMPEAPRARLPRIRSGDGMLLDVLGYIEGMRGYTWRDAPEFREIMAAVFIARDVMNHAAGKNLWDVKENAGIIPGSGGASYLVLPDGELAIFAAQDKLDRARKFMHIGGLND